jgi:hypothetical protein
VSDPDQPKGGWFAPDVDLDAPPAPAADTPISIGLADQVMALPNFEPRIEVSDPGRFSDERGF